MFDDRQPLAGAPDAISIHGAREPNLKNISLDVARNKFVVITGVSGSGKSTLAFDLLFAEGQRRFLDSMNVYARQFVEQLSKPDVDLITGIPPTVSIEQRTSRGGGKSTVATVTEIYHFIRLLYARLGTQYCPDCQVPVEAQTRDELERRLKSEQRRRGELFYLPDVDRGARADAIEESWFDWQEGNREICPECNGARLNPVARSVRLTLGNCSSRAPQTPSPRAGKKILNAKFSSSSS